MGMVLKVLTMGWVHSSMHAHINLAFHLAVVSEYNTDESLLLAI